MKRILHAVSFAATKHANQKRKNSSALPYINHPIEVAEHLAKVGGIEDEDILIAAILHDTIEDTATTKEEITALFGSNVTQLVMECTDDKSLDKQERKRLQIENAPKKSRAAKMIKIADKTCNLNDLLIDPPKDWSPNRQHEYFVWANQVVAGLLGENEALDECVKSVLPKGLEKNLQPESP